MRPFFPESLLHCQWICLKTKDKRSRQNKLPTDDNSLTRFLRWGRRTTRQQMSSDTFKYDLCLLLLRSAVGGNLAVRVDNNGDTVLWTSSLRFFLRLMASYSVGLLFLSYRIFLNCSGRLWCY